MPKKKRSPFSPAPFAALVLSLVLGLAAACSSPSSGIQGLSCGSSSDCNSGLQCLVSQAAPDGGGDAGCSSADRMCLKPCHADTDCAAQGPGLVCVTSCSGTAACVPQ